jgi:outer membrane lipoprotein SlyB
MAGLIDVGRSYSADAMSGMQRVSTLEEARERTKANLDTQAKIAATQQKQSSISAGAGIGALGGAYVGAKMGATLGTYAGPIGFAAGAVVGAAAGWLLNDLF